MMKRHIAAAATLILSLVPALSQPAMAQAPKITVFNQGGYLADYHVIYTFAGQRRVERLIDVPLGNKRIITLPPGSSGITVSSQLNTGFFWLPKRPIFTNEPAWNGACFKTYGTIFEGAWSRDCRTIF